MHSECVEIAGVVGIVERGLPMDVYRLARDSGCIHAELVEAAGMDASLFWYREARAVGVEHAQLVDAVTVHGLPAVLLRGFAERMVATPDVDVATVVFEMVAGVR